jgi:large subunit ribosomal protein L18e
MCFPVMCQIAVIVGNVTDDKRVYEVSAVKVAAWARILSAGDECLAFDHCPLSIVRLMVIY